MAATIEAATVEAGYLVPALTKVPSNRQRVFMWYFTAILVDLVVLNLFEEFWQWVEIATFSISLLAAVLLQVLLKLTIAIEHWVASFFEGKSGGFMKFLRFFCAWLVLFGSKFVILAALDFAFGSSVDFNGPFSGLVALIVVIIVMLAAEQGMVRLYRRLA
jgi:hypothetical protein